MSPEETSAKERILKTAVRLLLTASPKGLTTRGIAKEAGVNVAAIHYYFQTKENLIEQAYAAATEIGFTHAMQIFARKDLSARDRAIQFLQGYAIGIVEYPNISRAGFSGMLFAEKASERFSRYLGQMFEALRDTFREMGEADQKGQAGKALAALSSIILPFLFMGAFRGIIGIDYSDRAERDRYIELLVDALSGAKKEQ
jgi:TetR/AcrR family transcriptional regulator, regulator of cefoperazone and chloramphenicol sensitivity